MGFAQFLKILYSRLGLILAVVTAFAAAAAAVTMLVPKRYEAAASVIVEHGRTDTLAGPGGLHSGAEKIDNVISTQLDIIGSPVVALKVVDALKLENNPRAQELLAGSGPLRAVQEHVAGLREWVSDFLPGGAADRRERSLKDLLADQLLRNLRLKSNRDSRLIRVGFSAPDPEFAAAAANAFARAYLETVLQLRVKPAKQGSEWLDVRVREFKAGLEQAEARLAKFQQEKGIVATDERLDLESSRLSELSAQLSLAQSQSYESEARQRQLREFLSRRGEPPAEVLANPVVQQLRHGVADRQAKLAELSRRIGPNHPQYRAARTELEGLQQQLSEQMRTAAQSLLASGGVASQREAGLRGALEQQRSRVLGLKSNRNQLAMLIREVDHAQRAYNEAVQQLTRTRLESEIEQPAGSIVASAAIPARPVSPNATLNLAAALVAGLVLGMGLALFAETVNRYVRSEQDISEILGMPVLAVLNPKTGKRQNVRYLKGPTIHSLPGMR
jgi:polysaccharide biosynthesis transport protein